MRDPVRKNARLRVIASLAAVALSSAFMAPATAAPFAGAPVFTTGVPDESGIRDAGRTAPGTVLHLTMNLKYQHDAELDQDLLMISNPGSPQFRHFLNNAQWNAYFAPSAQTVANVEALLRRAGFQIEGISDNRSIIRAAAPVAVVERYFQTQFHNVVQGSVGVRYRNAIPAVLPSELRSYVTSVTGLDSLEVHHPQPPRGRGIASSSPVGPDIGAKLGGPIKSPDGGYGPWVLRGGYNYPVQHKAVGTGHTVGITIAGDILPTDLAAYLKFFKIKQTGVVSRVPIDGGSPPGAETETTLDVETIAGLAPGANIVIYQFPNWTTKFINDTFAKVVSDNAVDSFSNSWGWCETATGGLWSNTAIHKLFQQAEIKGATPIFASGDDGAFTRGCNGAVAVISPGSDPNVVTVGGLTITVSTAGAITAQTAWSGSGGGVSKVWPMPAYQVGVPGTQTGGRNVPDISLPADVQDSFYISGAWAGPIGGTSWAAPAFNAMLVGIDQHLGKRVGWVNQSLYTAQKTSGSAVFTDITTGNNGHFQAGPGYDLVSGLGAPNGWGLAQKL